MKRQGISRFLLGLTLGGLIAILTVVNILLIWVATGPRSLQMLTPYIEQALATESKYRVEIGETWLVWDGWMHPVDIRLRKVSVLTGDEVFSTFPEISLGIDILALSWGKILPTSLAIRHPVISLYQYADQSISFGVRGEKFSREPDAPSHEEGTEEVVPFEAILAPLISPEASGSLRKLRSVSILDADVSIGSRSQGVFFEASHVNFQAKRDRRGSINIAASGRIRYGEYQSRIQSQFAFDPATKTVEGQTQFTGLAPGVLATLFANIPELNGVNMSFSGNASMTMLTDGTFKRLGFQLQGGQGTVESEYLSGPLTVSALYAEGEARDNFTVFQLETLRANLGSMTLTGKGMVALHGDDTSAQGQLEIHDVPVDQASILWPPALSPMSREWVTQNITDGNVPQASAKIDIKPGDLAKPALPKEDVDASITLEGATIRYIPEHPQVHNVNGVIHVDGVSLNAEINGADFLKETKVSGGRLDIADLNADNPRIAIKFTGSTTAKDAVSFLHLPRVNHAAHLGLSEEAEGTANLTAALEFDFFAPRDAQGNSVGESDIVYNIDAAIKDISQPGFMKKFDIKDATGALHLQNGSVAFKGKGSVNGAEASQAEIRYLFEPQDGLDTFIDVKGKTPVESLPRFGYPVIEGLKGELGVEASLKLGDQAETASAMFDLADADIDIDILSWTKPPGNPATLELTFEKKGEATHIPSFKLKGKNIDVAGEAVLAKDMGGFQSISAGKSVLGETKLERVLYEHIDGGMRLETEGESLDLSQWLQGEPGKEANFSFQNFPAIQFKGKLDRLILGKDRALEDFNGDLNCTVKLCGSANISAKSGGKPVHFRILRNPKGVRQLSLHAENAASFLRAVNVHDGLDGGGISITGNYDDSAGNLKGRVLMTDFTMVDAPVLGKILSLASPTGFMDTLQGKGIRFDKLTAPFTLKNDVITFSKARAHGPAIGMTMEGTITMPKILLDLEGTVAPAYALNSVIGKVPVVGDMLTGGEGQGVFAARYSVKGPQSDPGVRVNPLSILTPGFLRNMFDIFDEPKKDEAE